MHPLKLDVSVWYVKEMFATGKKVGKYASFQLNIKMAEEGLYYIILYMYIYCVLEKKYGGGNC